MLNLSELTIFFILLHACKVTVSFLDIEELKELKYGIEITKKPVVLSHVSEDNVLHLSSKYGQMYQCNLPVRENKDKGTDEDSSHQNNLTIKAILDAALEGQCLYYTLGWWTYKVCYKKEITQYHEENGILQGNVISLGHFESEKDWDGKDYKKKQDKEEFHSHHYTNGSNCELVGKERETTVKFICNEDSSNLIVSVDETETCIYTITVSAKELCVHPLFKPKNKDSVKEIKCSPAIPEDQYQKYIKQEQEHLAKAKKAEEERQAKLQNLKKGGNVDVMKSAFDSLMSGFSSFVTKTFPDFESKDQKQEGADLSEFWNDLGYHPEGLTEPKEGSKKLPKEEVQEKAPADELDKTVQGPTYTADGKEEMSGDNAMSKGDNMLSSDGRFIIKDSKNAKTSAAKLNENVKRLLLLQQTIDEIDKQAAALIKKDQEKRKIFVEQFSNSKKKVEKQIADFRKLMKRLVSKRNKENDKQTEHRLNKLIKRVDGDIRKYKTRLSLLDAKVKKSLQRSKAFEKRYKDLTNFYSSKKMSKKTDINGAETIKSLNDVIRELRKEKQHDNVDRISKSGSELAQDDQSINESKGRKRKDTLDPMLEAVMKMLKLGNVNEKKAVEEEQKDISDVEKQSTASVESSTENEEQSKKVETPEDQPKEQKESASDKIRVRITRLGSEAKKLLEEDEKQEELSGTNGENNKLKQAGKKIEDMIKKKLKKAGVDVGANIKIKIITNDGPLSTINANSKTDFLTDETATQFKDMLVNMLGGGAEKVKEEKRQSELEDSYRFVWNQNSENENNERTDSEED